MSPERPLKEHVTRKIFCDKRLTRKYNMLDYYNYMRYIISMFETIFAIIKDHDQILQRQRYGEVVHNR